MAKKADRYTVLVTPFEDLREKIKSVDSLEMKWMCSSGSHKGCADLHVFFDKAGMDNYLSGLYGEFADKVKSLVYLVDAGELGAEEAVKQIKEMLGY